MKELAKQYNPEEVEDRIYDMWLKGHYFHAEVNPNKKPFTIMMPPPNVTGQLHMGHALDNTLQDSLIRWKRMQGYEALWQPGSDHAAIATEVKVTNKLKEQARQEMERKPENVLAGIGGAHLKILRHSNGPVQPVAHIGHNQHQHTGNHNSLGGQTPAQKLISLQRADSQHNARQSRYIAQLSQQHNAAHAQQASQ